MDYIAIHIKIEPFSEDIAEIVEAEIEEIGFDSFTIEAPILNAFIPARLFSEEEFDAAFKNLAFDGHSLTYTVEFVKEQNWNAVWESDFEPVVIGRKCTIKAPYHHGLPRSRYNVTINPQMSFGTGHHQTTSMIVETIIDCKNEIVGKNVLDMGCGTGILAIMASKLGANSPVCAIDIEQICAVSTEENVRRNRVGGKVDVLCGDASLIQPEKYDVIFANINRNILIQDMPKYVAGLHDGGIIYMSGFYTEDIPLLQERAETLGLTKIFQKSKENWALIKLKKC